MAFDIKKQETQEGVVINFNKEDHRVVEIKGKPYVVHAIQAEKLIKAKKAKEVKNVDFEQPERNKTVRDIKTK